MKVSSLLLGALSARVISRFRGEAQRAIGRVRNKGLYWGAGVGAPDLGQLGKRFF